MKYPNITLGKMEAIINKLGGEEGVEKFLQGELKISENPTKPILEPISKVTVPSTTTKFLAKEKFILGTSRNATVKISFLGGNFTEWFLSGEGKTEDPITEQVLLCHKLLESSVDGPIITELGGETKAETTLTELYSLMKKQKNAEAGALLNNGYANIFYIRDGNGMLRAVGVDWYDGGWDVDAFSIENPRAWDGGLQVFSRNLAL